MKQWINNLGGRQVSQSICGMRHSKKTTTYETKHKKKKKKTSGMVTYNLLEEYQSGRDLI